MNFRVGWYHFQENDNGIKFVCLQWDEYTFCGRSQPVVWPWIEVRLSFLTVRGMMTLATSTVRRYCLAAQRRTICGIQEKKCNISEGEHTRRSDEF